MQSFLLSHLGKIPFFHTTKQHLNSFTLHVNSIGQTNNSSKLDWVLNHHNWIKALPFWIRLKFFNRGKDLNFGNQNKVHPKLPWVNIPWLSQGERHLYRHFQYYFCCSSCWQTYLKVHFVVITFPLCDIFQ